MKIVSPLGGAGGRLTALAFITDPRLGAIDTPTGRLEFLAALGITTEELAEAKASNTQKVVARISGEHGLPLTDVTR